MAKKSKSTGGCEVKRKKSCQESFSCKWNPETKKCSSDFLPYILGGAAIAVVAALTLRGARATSGSTQKNGCTDTKALNYDPTATNDDGSCIYPQPGLCTPGLKRNQVFCQDQVTLKSYEECNAQGSAFLPKSNNCPPPAQSCTFGDKRNQVFCSDGKTLKSWEECTVPSQNFWSQKQQTCPVPQFCTPGLKRNEVYCADGVTLRSYEECDAQGSAFVQKTGTCPPPAQCSGTQTRCNPLNNNVVQVCVNGQYQDAQSCGFGCAFGQCLPPPNQCSPNGITRCNGNTVQECINGNWQGIMSCAQCSGGKCVPPTGQCTNGDLRCDPQNPAFIQECRNGSWQYKDRCSFGCSGGKCNPGSSCTQNAVRCWNNRVRQKCNNGVWVDDQVCIYDCRPDGSCRACSIQDEQNQLRRCNGRTVEQCINGVWTGIQTCANQCTGLGNCS